MHAKDPQFVVKLCKVILSLLIRANYHEYPVKDDRGNVIAYEFFTRHGGMIFKSTVESHREEKTDRSRTLM